MSLPGRPKGEFRKAHCEATSMSQPGRARTLIAQRMARWAVR